MKRLFDMMWGRLLSRLQLTVATHCVLRASGGGDRDLEFLRTSWKSHLPDLPDPIESITRVDKAKKLILFWAFVALNVTTFVGWYSWILATACAVVILFAVIVFWPGNILSLVSKTEFDSYYGFMRFFMDAEVEEDADSAFEDLVQE